MVTTKTDTTEPTQAPTTDLVLTPEEIQAILSARTQLVSPTPTPSGSVDISALTQALIAAINSTKDIKAKPYRRKKNNPYFPKDGSPRLKLRRKCMQHGIEIDEDQLYNEDIDGLNKMKFGRYCGGFVRVIKRKDGSLDIDYPVRTSAQKLKLMNSFGITTFSGLIQRILAERAEPLKYKPEDEDDE